MKKYIGPEGPHYATVAIVGEKPGRVEVMQNRPFVGPSGSILNDVLEKTGLFRDHIYITSVIKEIEDFRTPTDHQIKEAIPKLYRELSRLPKLKVVVPLGSVALKAVSNFQYESILNYRGSILHTPFQVKMVPSVHPAFIIRGNFSEGFYSVNESLFAFCKRSVAD